MLYQNAENIDPFFMPTFLLLIYCKNLYPVSFNEVFEEESNPSMTLVIFERA